MIRQETLQGRWNEISGKLRRRWGQLTDDELDRVHGSVEQLVGLIQRKTGESRDAIERFLDEADSGAGPGVAGTAERIRERAQECVTQAQEKIHETTGRVSEAMKHKVQDAQEMIKRRPAESVLGAFVAGLIGGLVVGLIVRHK